MAPSIRVRIHSSMQDSSVDIINRACAKAKYEFGGKFVVSYSAFILFMGNVSNTSGTLGVN